MAQFCICFHHPCIMRRGRNEGCKACVPCHNVLRTGGNEVLMLDNIDFLHEAITHLHYENLLFRSYLFITSSLRGFQRFQEMQPLQNAIFECSSELTMEWNRVHLEFYPVKLRRQDVRALLYSIPITVMS